MNDTTLRTQAVTLLLAAGTIAGSKVEDSHPLTYEADEALPAISVATIGADHEGLGIADTSGWGRTVKLAVIGTIEAAENEGSKEVAQRLDAFELELMSALGASGSFLNLLGQPLDWGPTSKKVHVESAKLRGQVVVTLNCAFDLELTYSGTVDDLETVTVNTDLVDPSGGPADRNETSVEVHLT